MLPNLFRGTEAWRFENFIKNQQGGHALRFWSGAKYRRVQDSRLQMFVETDSFCFSCKTL